MLYHETLRNRYQHQAVAFLSLRRQRPAQDFYHFTLVLIRTFPRTMSAEFEITPSLSSTRESESLQGAADSLRCKAEVFR
jgi:hypothetical protein